MTTPAHTRAVAVTFDVLDMELTGDEYISGGAVQAAATKVIDELMRAGLLADPAHDARVWDEGFSKGQLSEVSDPANWSASKYANPYRIERQEGER